MNPIPLITTKLRKPNMRLFELHGKIADGTATPSEREELDLMEKALEQDNFEEFE